MPRVIITAQVEDSTQWEEGFRTQGALLRSMSSTVTHFTTNEDNGIALYAEPADLDQYLAVLESPATAEAMAHDGVKKETVKVYVLDREFTY